MTQFSQQNSTHTYAPCPRCKTVHKVDTTQSAQTCPYCGARWPREKNAV